MTQYVGLKPAPIAQKQRHQGWQHLALRLSRPLLRGPRWRRLRRHPAGAPAAFSASFSRFNYLTVKANRPRRAAGGDLRLVRRVRSGRTRRQRAAIRLPRNAPDSEAPQRHIAYGAHATLKFRNRRLSRTQLAINIWPNTGGCFENGRWLRSKRAASRPRRAPLSPVACIDLPRRPANEYLRRVYVTWSEIPITEHSISFYKYKPT